MTTPTDLEMLMLSFIHDKMHGYFMECQFEQVQLSDVLVVNVFQKVLDKIADQLERMESNKQIQSPEYENLLWKMSLKYLKDSRDHACSVIISLQQKYRQHLLLSLSEERIKTPNSASTVDSTQCWLSNTQYAEFDALFASAVGQPLYNQEDVKLSLNKCLDILSNMVSKLVEDVLPHRHFTDKDIQTKRHAFCMVWKRLWSLKEYFAGEESETMWQPLFLQLVQNSLILMKFPKDGVIVKHSGSQTGTKISVVVASLLPCHDLRVLEDDLGKRIAKTMQIRYVDANAFSKWRKNDCHLDSLPAFTNVHCQASGQAHEFSIEKLKLTALQANSHQTGCRNKTGRVTEKKGIFVFYYYLNLKGLQPVRILVASDTVVPVSNKGQSAACATLFMDSLLRAPLFREKLDETAVVPVTSVVNMLDAYLRHFTGKGFFADCQREYFSTKFLNSYMVGSDNVDVPVEVLNSPPSGSSGCGIPLWEWFWSCVKMIRDDIFIRSLWNEELLLGFVEKHIAQKLCRSKGAFVIRFMASKRGDLSIQCGKTPMNFIGSEALSVKPLQQHLHELHKKGHLLQFAHRDKKEGDCGMVLARFQHLARSGVRVFGYVASNEVNTELFDLVNSASLSLPEDVPLENINECDLDTNCELYHLSSDDETVEDKHMMCD